MPEDLVLTPGGYKPRAQVHAVPPQHMLRMADQNIHLVQANGALVRDLGLLVRKPGPGPLMPANLSQLRPSLPQTLRLEPRPGTVPSGVAPFAQVDGWICNTGWTNTTGHPISRFATTWVVPPEPAVKGNQTVFLFNGIQNSTMIYQPVLQWGPSGAGGGKFWAVASWYADGQTGQSFHSTLVPVAVGQTLTGVMSLVKQTGNAFDYACEFTGIANTQLPIQGVEQLTWANETLEAYGITECGHYPATSRTVFSGISLHCGNTTPALSWGVSNSHTECGQHVKVVNGAAENGQVDIWYKAELQEGAWIARHNLTSAEYQATFDDLVGNQGMQLVDVSGYGVGGQARYAALWIKRANAPAWVARHGLTSAQYQQAFNDLTAQGFHPVLVNGYTVNDQDRYAAIFQKSAVGAWVARHGLTNAQYQAAFDDFLHQGYTLTWVSGYSVGGQDRYAAIWQKLANVPAWVARHGLTSAQYQQNFDAMLHDGFKLTHVSGYSVGGQDRYAAIWQKLPNPPAWAARHGLTAAQYQQAFNDLVGQGYRLTLVSGYAVNDDARFAAIWSK